MTTTTCRATTITATALTATENRPDRQTRQIHPKPVGLPLTSAILGQ